MISSERDSRNSKVGAARQGSRRRIVILNGGFVTGYEDEACS
jgi:hypothetical protein